MQNIIDSELFKKMFLAGTKYLQSQKAYINNLNVFPVPDGDTGTNMMLTLIQAANSMAALNSEVSISELCSIISSGTLRGARGNSGVILSQLCRGFCMGSEGLNVMDKKNVARAMEKGVTAAYKAVMKPQEGTILTVAKKAAEKAVELCGTDLSMGEFLTEINKQAHETLLYTPELLPVLKEAGVVDSGGQGLCEFFDGALAAFSGQEIVFEVEDSEKKTTKSELPRGVAGEISSADIKYGYCTEFIVELNDGITYKDEQEFKQYLSTIGDSIVCVRVDDVAKVHVHTNHPGLALEKALTFGALSNLKIDNMRIEHRQRVIEAADLEASEASRAASKKENGFITVCTGDGLAELFRNLNVDIVIDGGQTMNPSTSDFIDAIKEINAENVFILPNNGNIIMAAKQAQNMAEGVNVCVIPTKTVCQGISAMIGFVPSLDPEGNIESMTECASDVKTGEVTYAVRDTVINGMKIAVGDFMGIGEGEILAVSKNRIDAAVELVKKLADDSSEIISLYYGADSDEDEAGEIASIIEEAFPDADVEVAFGGQSVYNYLISVE